MALLAPIAGDLGLLGVTALPAEITLVLKGGAAALLVLVLDGAIVLNNWDGGARKNSVGDSMIVFYGLSVLLRSVSVVWCEFCFMIFDGQELWNFYASGECV